MIGASSKGAKSVEVFMDKVEELSGEPNKQGCKKCRNSNK